MVMGYYVVSLYFSKKSSVSAKSFREMYPSQYEPWVASLAKIYKIQIGT
jgi:hypothetical protein